MWRKIKKILTKAPKKLLRFRPGFLQPTSAPAGPPAASVLPPHPLTENKNAQKIRRVETPIPNDAQDLLKPKVNRELKPKPKVYRELKPRSKVNRELKPRPTPYTSIYPCLPTNDDTPSYSSLSQRNLIHGPRENSPHPVAPSIPDVLPVVDVEDEDSARSLSNRGPRKWEASGAEGLLPRYFLRRSRSDVSLPRRSKKNHVFTPTYCNLAMSEEDAVVISEKRKRAIRENTVFEAPQKWHEWETRRGKRRIVSSEPVRTVACKRANGTSFIGTVIGLRYAIFEPSNGHLMDFESLGQGYCQSECHKSDDIIQLNPL